MWYRKYEGSTYVDPHEEEKVAFKDLPNRFPSVLSSDFRKEQDQYEDIDNLFAMYLLYNLSKHRVRVNDETKLLEIDKTRIPMAYPEAAGACHPKREGRQRKLSSPSAVPAAGNGDRGTQGREREESGALVAAFVSAELAFTYSFRRRFHSLHLAPWLDARRGLPPCLRQSARQAEFVRIDRYERG